MSDPNPPLIWVDLDPGEPAIHRIALAVTDAALEIVAEMPELLAGSTSELAGAQSQLVAFLLAHTEPGKSPLCGDSLGPARRLLARTMPDLHELLHYRNIDVSTVRALVRRWYPQLAPVQRVSGGPAQRIRGAIAELRLYRAGVFR